jgi:hypothetical protein
VKGRKNEYLGEEGGYNTLWFPWIATAVKLGTRSPTFSWDILLPSSGANSKPRKKALASNHSRVVAKHNINIDKTEVAANIQTYNPLHRQGSH